MHSIKIQIKFHWKLETQFGFEKKTIKFIYLSTSSLMLFNLQWKTREVDSKKTEEAISCGLNVPAHIFYEISFHICIGYVCIVKKWIFATSRPIEWKTKEFKEGWYFGTIHSPSSCLACRTSIVFVIACYSQNDGTQNKQNSQFHCDFLSAMFPSEWFSEKKFSFYMSQFSVWNSIDIHEIKILFIKNERYLILNAIWIYYYIKKVI